MRPLLATCLRMSRSRGFTFLELVVAIAVAGILLSITIRTFGSVRHSFAAQQGRQVFESLHARARAQAIESGTVTRLVVDVDGDSISLVRGAAVLETIRMRSQMDVDIVGSSLVLCMNSRGFADTACNSFAKPTELVFESGSEKEAVLLLPLGQITEPVVLGIGFGG